MKQLDTNKFMKDTAHDLRAIRMKPSEFMLDVLRQDNEFFLPAIHEAGHAVVAWALWHTVKKIDLRDRFSLVDGHYGKMMSYQLHVTEQGVSSGKLHADMAMITLAGLLAERILLPGHDEALAWNSDLKQVIESVQSLSLIDELDENTFEMLLEDAELLVEENKDQIMVLAMAALQLGPILDGKNIEAILDILTSKEWEELLSE